MKNDFKRFHKAVTYVDSLSNLPLFADYMKVGKQPHPEIYLKRMRYFLKLLGNPEKDFKVVGSLPYYITSPIIRKFLEAKNPPEFLLLMVQIIEKR